MTDGSKLRQSWYSALDEAEAHFRQLLSSSSSEWRRVSNSSEASSSKKGKTRTSSSIPELSDVVVHRNSTSGDDIYRLVLDVPTGDEQVSLEPWKAVLTTPELRQEWDPAVEEAHLMEMFDRMTRISKTNFTLGWPANPRDSVTISRTFHDTTTIIDISTSLPRSPDEPAYLRPSPPYVRSQVKLFAWCIQHIQSQPPSPSDDQSKKKPGRLRITCFWQHDLKALWGFGSSSNSIVQQLSTMTLSLLKTVIKRGGRVPKLIGYGNGVSIERVRFQVDREALTVDYTIIPEDDDQSVGMGAGGLDDVQTVREQRRLTRSIECILPSMEGWDVQVSLKASSEEVEQLPWSAHAIKRKSSVSSISPPDQILLKITHAALNDEHAVLRVKVVIEVSGGSRGLRLNGLPKAIMDVEERDPSSYIIPQKILQDVASAADLSFRTTSSMATAATGSSTGSNGQPLIRPHTEKTPAAEKSILSRVRRNYIYFSSLLQEPEAKWRRTTEARGVSITQLDSIDPTLVVYRAEATFVGVGLWDLYGAVVSPGAKAYWDKQHEDAILLEDVNELTELWHYKTKPAWPVNGRDSVVLKSVYKSPTTIHVFAFSAEDPHLFRNIPPAEPNVIRTQVDLQGWAIEALSPTTTLLTLLEQSDPKGWTNKTSIPTQMINTLAGIGEFAIKCGGPPLVSRLAGAKANEMRYDHEKGSFKVEYEPSASRRTVSGNEEGASGLPTIECEIRCDIDKWANSLDIVVDPPPQTITCLRRHKLSAEGGGLWLTMTHDSVFVDDERLLALVRRAPGKEKGLVMVNGAKIQVDVEELPEHEIKSLRGRKRVKPKRIPLDQPPVMGVIRRRKAEWSTADEDSSSTVTDGSEKSTGGGWASAPMISSPLARFFTYAVDQATTTTQQAVAAISPINAPGSSSVPSPSKAPMQYALEALAWVQEFHGRSSMDGWTLVSDKGLVVNRKVVPEISPIIPVHKGSKVIEGVSAEEIATVIQEFDCRRKWDDRFDSAKVLESFGGDCRTVFLVSKSGFPFRDRGFYLASTMARSHVVPSMSRRNTGEVAEQSNGPRNAIFCVAASYSPDSAATFAPGKYNPYALPIGRVYVDAWVLETLDPYTKENYAIPSTRCTRFVAVDYSGSIPAAVNSMINATLPRSILAVESYIKGIASLPLTRLPTPGVVITEKRPHEHLVAYSWKIRRRDEHRVLVKTGYGAEERVYKSVVFVRMGTGSPMGSPSGPGARSPTRAGDQAGKTEQTTPRSSGIAHLSPTRSQALEGLPGGLNSPGSDGSLTPGLPGISPSPPPTYRQRALSSTSGLSSSGIASTQHDRALRGRASTSAFTLKGEVKPPTDLLVAELVVDSKLYPEGYDVSMKSKMRSSVKVGVRGGQVPLAFPSSSSSPSATASTSTTPPTDSVLPLAYTVHTMPSSPLHSSGLNSENTPTRHLIRLTLPTAQYQISTVQDPLTGETRSAPPKPAWLEELQEGGAMVEVTVRPRVANVEAGGEVDKAKAKEGKGKVRVDGKDVVVVSEKESLTTLGREELLDDRVGKMAILSRVPNEPEPLPDELKVPLGVADDLFDPSAAGGPSMLDGAGDAKLVEENAGVVSLEVDDSSGLVSGSFIFAFGLVLELELAVDDISRRVGRSAVHPFPFH
ncbi:hypothetical protein BDQ12DRAFT_681024 [Crucibulum laeve]|uniref:START domain-containing protein n=1 Tax=Crucibulum laeve TaxID=68775 RepID=A0A5C3MEU3_9AGAR|nr:hypothetical protein BDQ12DRAFT_681024 [Crucibulum laeve]